MNKYKLFCSYANMVEMRLKIGISPGFCPLRTPIFSVSVLIGFKGNKFNAEINGSKFIFTGFPSLKIVRLFLG